MPHWEKQHHFFLSSSKAVHVNLQNEQVSITHHAWLPYQPSKNIIQCSPWADWTSPLKKTEQHRQWTVILTPTVEGGGMLNLPWRMGVGQRAELSVNKCRKSNRGWKHDRMTSQLPTGDTSTEQNSGEAQRLRTGVGQWDSLPKQDRWCIPQLISWTEGSIRNWIAPPSWGRN
jgi:hypothetical protein